MKSAIIGKAKKIPASGQPIVVNFQMLKPKKINMNANHMRSISIENFIILSFMPQR